MAHRTMPAKQLQDAANESRERASNYESESEIWSKLQSEAAALDGAAMIAVNLNHGQDHEKWITDWTWDDGAIIEIDGEEVFDLSECSVFIEPNHVEDGEPFDPDAYHEAAMKLALFLDAPLVPKQASWLIGDHDILAIKLPATEAERAAERLSPPGQTSI